MNEKTLDPIAAAILEALAQTDKTLSPQDIAKVIAGARAKPVVAGRAKPVVAGRANPKDPPDVWKKYLAAVKQQAVHLARSGRLEILRKGKPADPDNFKGVVRLRLKK